MEENIAYHDITKEYKRMFKIIAYKNGFDPYKLSKSNKNKKKKIKIDPNQEDSAQRSVRRSRSLINDYANCNDFEWFVTFTFNPKKVDRYDLDCCYLKMQGWLWRTHRKYENFKYIIVPERHKDGAVHFHALISGYGGNMKKTNVLQDGRRVFNITGFTFGFTNAQKVDEDVKATVAYLAKYITKDMEKIHNRRRFWSSKNLEKPMTVYDGIFAYELFKFMSEETVTHRSPYNTIHEIPKSVLTAFE
jgi:hypothetical protein